MAEIRVQPKPRSLAWLWILLALAVIGLVAWYLLSQGLVRVRDTTPAPAAQSSLAPAPLPALAALPVASTAPGAAARR